ncbi:hypothetical protein [[Mycoplasma] testudinis]|uniref:hypothetical protein n=1 Tax=[Mycoplasma] testudinis TaxID=33924 RepID=UPI00047F4307|nr:hypothetical protein [[Mycoplasma] testudinis]
MQNFKKYGLNFIGTLINLITNLILPFFQIATMIVAVFSPKATKVMEKASCFIKLAGKKFQKLELSILNIPDPEPVAKTYSEKDVNKIVEQKIKEALGQVKSAINTVAVKPKEAKPEKVSETKSVALVKLENTAKVTKVDLNGLTVEPNEEDSKVTVKEIEKPKETEETKPSL